MKKKFFLPLLAAAVLSACSSENDLTIGDNGEGSKDYGYVAVNIAQPASAGTRDASEGFKYGTAEENHAETGLFFIFNETGTVMYGAPQTLNLSDAGTTGNTPEVEKVYNAVLVIDRAEGKPETAKQIVCVLNAPAGLDQASTLAELTEKIADYETNNKTKGKFIMTNSVYKDGETKVLGALVTDANLHQSAALALANPVNIFVERVVAKVEASAGGSFDNSEGATATVDGKEVKLAINVTGIEIANIANSAYLFKNINGITDKAWAWDVANRRSYWETVSDTITYRNQSYNQIASDKDFNIATASLSDYIQPNTNSASKTSVLVTAQLCNQADGKPYEMVYFRGGYFSPEGAANLIAAYVAQKGYWKLVTIDDKGNTEYKQLSAGDFEWYNKYTAGVTGVDFLKDYEVLARVKAGDTKLYKKEGTEYKEVAKTEIDGELATKDYIARYYTNGMCYYFVNIDQTPVANQKLDPKAASHTFDGVIRNHIYELNLNSISGIGTPVFNPEDVIIPVKPDDEDLWYLSAKINVLAWKLVKQDVNFEGI